MIPLLALLLALPSAKAPSFADPWLVVPGVRVGRLTAQTQRADLERIFGADHIKDSMEGPGGDQEAEPATVVHGDRPDESLVIFWLGTSPDQTTVPRKARINFVRICGTAYASVAPPPCKWHLAHGIRPGTTLKELEALNGRAFTLEGLGWDYGGVVMDWEGGTLVLLSNSCGRVGISLNPPDSDALSVAGKADYEAVSGDRTIASSAPAMERLNPRIHEMAVSLNPLPRGACAVRGRERARN